MDDLKPCPFCGESVQMNDYTDKPAAAWVLIHRCKVIGPISITRGSGDPLVSAWNTRTPDLAAEVLRLRAEVERLTGDAANVRKKAFTEAMAAISDQRCGANWNAISTAISEIQKLMKEQPQ